MKRTRRSPLRFSSACVRIRLAASTGLTQLWTCDSLEWRVLPMSSKRHRIWRIGNLYQRTVAATVSSHSLTIHDVRVINDFIVQSSSLTLNPNLAPVTRTPELGHRRRACAAIWSNPFETSYRFSHIVLSI